MQELTQTRHDGPQIGPGGNGRDPFASNETSNGTATVSHWPYSEQLAVAGLTVRQIRDRYRDRFDLHPQSQAILNGDQVSDDTVVNENQVLMFVRRAGEKGQTCSHSFG